MWVLSKLLSRVAAHGIGTGGWMPTMRVCLTSCFEVVGAMPIRCVPASAIYHAGHGCGLRDP